MSACWTACDAQPTTSPPLWQSARPPGAPRAPSRTRITPARRCPDMAKSQQELRTIRDSVERVGRLSDNLIRVGPFRLGIDGVLSWVPGLGELYSAGAALFI